MHRQDRKGDRKAQGGTATVPTSSAIEVEETAGGKVNPLLALAVVIQGDLLCLQQQITAQLHHT